MPDEWLVVDEPTADDDYATVDPSLPGECRVGDQVSASRAWGLYRHHGVLLEGGRVLHVNAGPFSGVAVCLGLRPAMVRVDGVARFLKGDTALRREWPGDPARRMPEAAAGASVPYNLLFNNCETFARANVGRARRSPQVERAALGGAALAACSAASSLAAAALAAVAGCGSIAAHAVLRT